LQVLVWFGPRIIVGRRQLRDGLIAVRQAAFDIRDPQRLDTRRMST
jgi:hypothetical protein